MTIRKPVPILLAALLSGCGFFSHTPNAFYSLDRIAPKAPIAGLRGLPVGIDVVLPPGVDRKEVVVRLAGHRMDVRGTELWTASLEPLLEHTLASDLASRLPDGMVILPGQSKPPGGMRSLDLTVEELAAGPERVVMLDAQWSLRDTVSGNSILAHHEHIAIDVESLESANVASGISRVLALLADRIAAELSAPTRG